MGGSCFLVGAGATCTCLYELAARGESRFSDIQCPAVSQENFLAMDFGPLQEHPASSRSLSGN